jgi:glycosyltransferase family protein
VSIYLFGRDIERAIDCADRIRIYKEQTSGETSVPIKYIFTEIPEHKKIDHYTKAGIDAGQLVSMYQYLTDNDSLKLSIKTEKKLEELKESLHYTGIIHLESEIRLVKGGYVIAVILLDERDRDHLWGICYYSYTKLLRMEVYTDRIIFSNSYITAASENGLYAKLARRTFYNRDGSAAYDQVFEGEEEKFLFPDGRVFMRMQVVEEFIKVLDLSEEDVVILDDSVPSEFMQAVFTFGKAAQFAALAHIGHHSSREKKSESRFWNGYYYDWFPYAEMLDTMVVSTEEQKKLLLEELEEYHCHVPAIRVAPISGKFDSAALYEFYNGDFVLRWNYKGSADGFWIYDELGMRIYETNDVNRHHFMIKSLRKESGFFIKAFVNTIKGKMAAAESEQIYFSGEKFVNILDMQETLEYMKDRQTSAARFGDGEINLMTGHSIPYQDYDEELAKKLKQIISNPDHDNLLVCLPDIFERRERYHAECSSFWERHLEQYRDFYAEVILGGKCYGSAFLSRPYMDLADKSISGKHFQNLKTFFADKNILIVEGFYSRSGVGNDLFQGANSVKRIICPSHNAYSKYGMILDTIRQQGKDKLILLMLGPTAKVLACDLAYEGYWALDIGHIDSEYEWYKMGAMHKVKFKNKHAAEFNFDENIELENDDIYAKEIVAMLADQQ